MTWREGANEGEGRGADEVGSSEKENGNKDEEEGRVVEEGE